MSDNLIQTCFQEVKFDEHLIQRLHLDAGRCHTFSVALGKLSKVPYSVLICLRTTHDRDGEFMGQSFSHAVTEINGILYDCRGPGADVRWEERWDPKVFQDEDGETSEFDWFEIKNSPSLKNVVHEIMLLGMSCNADDDVDALISEIMSPEQKNKAQGCRL